MTWQGVRDKRVTANRRRQHGQEQIGPHAISVLLGMEKIRHERSGQPSVGEQKPVVEIAPHDAPAVAEPLQHAVHGLVAAAQRVVRILAARKDSAKDYFRPRLLGDDTVEDGLDSAYRVNGSLLAKREVPSVVRAYHQDNRLGLVAVQLAVVDPPEHMLRAVASIAEAVALERLCGEIAVPHPPSTLRTLPSMRYGIAQEHDLRHTVRGEGLSFGALLLEALHPPSGGIGILRNWRQ